MKDIKKYYDDEFVKTAVLEIARSMYRDNFKPDYIVGLTRGGLIPGVLLSHYLDVPFYALNKNESNLWMAEDAFGYVDEHLRATLKSRWDIGLRKRILVIDDINDTGATFGGVKRDWQDSCLPNEADAWRSVWHNTVKFAALINNEASEFDVDYSGTAINKAEQPEWCVFPWENWW